MNPCYSPKTILDWMNEMHGGSLALADFQRSLVWEDKLVSRYLKAILTDQPTGTLLMVKPGEDLKGRGIDGNEADIKKATTLILDGQQRLTSLWHGLMDAGSRIYYIEVENLSELQLKVSSVISRTKRSQDFATVAEQFSKNIIPIRILYDPPNHLTTKNAPTRLEKWCEEAIPDDTSKAGTLRRAIKEQLRDPLQHYAIWHAKFSGINAGEAVEIFINTNQSSIKVKAFDLAVAKAVQVKRDIKFRERVKAFHDSNDRVKYYFSDNQDRWLPDIGACLLKIACLKIDERPKDTKFNDSVEYLFDSGTRNADEVEVSLNAALHFLENHGVPTKDFLPRVPPLYVIAALQSDIENIPETRRAQAVNLITKYLWWSFLSNRYERQANDRLYDDYVGLRRDLRFLKQNGETQTSTPIFKEAELIKRKELAGDGEPFRTKSPLGRAIVALTLYNRAKDWVTGEEFSPSTVRDLEHGKILDRHHVFPRRALTRGENPLKPDAPLIHHAMNIVLLRKKANITLGGKEPAVYLARLLQRDSQLKDQDLEKRVASHMSPY